MIKLFLLRLILPISLVFNTWAQMTPGLYILSPVSGQVVEGTVEIKGSVPDDNFDYAELSYSFGSEETTNWFIIQRIEEPIHDDVLAMWDTTTITDGVYCLRLSVNQKNGIVEEIVFCDIKVGNYTYYEEATPTTAAVISQETVEISSTPTQQRTPEPTALPENPASIDLKDVGFSLSSGLVLAVLTLAAIGLYTYFRLEARK